MEELDDSYLDGSYESSGESCEPSSDPSDDQSFFDGSLAERLQGYARQVSDYAGQAVEYVWSDGSEVEAPPTAPPDEYAAPPSAPDWSNSWESFEWSSDGVLEIDTDGSSYAGYDPWADYTFGVDVASDPWSTDAYSWDSFDSLWSDEFWSDEFWSDSWLDDLWVDTSWFEDIWSDPGEAAEMAPLMMLVDTDPNSPLAQALSDPNSSLGQALSDPNSELYAQLQDENSVFNRALEDPNSDLLRMLSDPNSIAQIDLMDADKLLALALGEKAA